MDGKCPDCGSDTRPIVFEHEWCDKCARAVDISGPRPFQLNNPFFGGNLTKAHADDIKCRVRIKDGNGEKVVRNYEL